MHIIHTDGSEEIQPRCENEIAAIEAENRIAARSNIRSQYRRESDRLGFDLPIIGDRRQGNRRAILSSFERHMLLKKEDA